MHEYKKGITTHIYKTTSSEGGKTLITINVHIIISKIIVLYLKRST